MKKRKAETCLWEQDGYYKYIFISWCRKTWDFENFGSESPEMAGFVFCPTCGKNVEVKK